MSLALVAEKYSITLWMGDAQGPLADFDIRHEISQSSPADASKLFEPVLREMTFIKLISDFFRMCPCRITLIGTSRDILFASIERVVKAYQEVLACRAEWEISEKSEMGGLKAYGDYKAAVTKFEAIKDPEMLVETIPLW
jgi:hypothetical protein